MIVVHLKGGLGNQLFQYACGRALSLREGDADLKLNTIGLSRANEVGDVYRPYSLSHFNIKASVATPEEIERIANPYGIVSKALRYAKAKYLYNFYIHFVPSILRKRGQVYLDGYFQSEQYFKDFEEEIRQDLVLREPSAQVLAWKEKLALEEHPVSLHVRRGDYVGHATLGGICTEEYYAAAIKKMLSNAPQARFYIFSDDVEWVRTHLDLPENTEYVSSPSLKDYEELTIMSMCRHNIIANSSFSWWGAWLNAHKDKMVIAPVTWVRGARGKKQNQDTVPQNWIKIDPSGR